MLVDVGCKSTKLIKIFFNVKRIRRKNYGEVNLKDRGVNRRVVTFSVHLVTCFEWDQRVGEFLIIPRQMPW